MIDYSPLWETMKKKEITQYKLLKDKVIDNKALDTLRKKELFVSHLFRDTNNFSVTCQNVETFQN